MWNLIDAVVIEKPFAVHLFQVLPDGQATESWVTMGSGLHLAGQQYASAR